jgi:F-type H+-transporting ATPase subunit c
VNKIASLLFLSLGGVLATASPLWAQDGSGKMLTHVGVGLTLIGAGLGIGKVGASACEGMSRQPEMAGTIQTAMLIAAALIEGLAFFALYICMS